VQPLDNPHFFIRIDDLIDEMDQLNGKARQTNLTYCEFLLHLSRLVVHPLNLLICLSEVGHLLLHLHQVCHYYSILWFSNRNMFIMK
jgi:hypothetical protein